MEYCLKPSGVKTGDVFAEGEREYLWLSRGVCRQSSDTALFLTESEVAEGRKLNG